MNASALLDVAVRCGLLAEAQVAECGDALANASDPFAWLVDRKLLASDEADLLRSRLAQLDADRTELQSLVKRGTLSEDAAALLERHQRETISPSRIPSIRDVARELEVPLDPQTPSAIGPYQVLRELGRGGMGVVYAARDPRLGRDVAIKLLRGPVAKSDLQRFQREARLTAHLHHPRIVSVFDVGIDRPSPYIVMTLVEGESLATRKLPRRDAVALLASIADAVHYAHEQGIVHRDLKPENILIDRDGRGYVTDFGLAKDVRADSSLTVSGTVFGTPAYMSPEQARGDTRHIGPRSDVWSLGATLYFVLTGRIPFSGAKPLEVLKKIQEEDPRPPHRHDSTIHRDLEVICLKALEKNPQRRYATAKDFADDLRRYLAGEPIAARPPSGAERIGRWAARHKLAIGGVVTILALSLAGLWTFGTSMRRGEFRRAKEAAEAAFGKGDWKRALLESERGLGLARDERLEAVARESRARLAAEESAQRKLRWLQEELKPRDERIADATAYFYVPGNEIEQRLVRIQETLAELETLADDPRNASYPELWRTLGIGWYTLGDDRKAEETLLRADDGPSNFFLGKIYLQRAIVSMILSDVKSETERKRVSKSWSEKALHHLERSGGDWAREIDRSVALAYHEIASERPVRPRCTEALAKFGDALGTEEFHFLLGILNPMSLEEITKAIDRKPHFALALLVRSGLRPPSDVAGIRSDLDRTIRSNPRFATAYFNRSNLRWNQKDAEGAWEDVEAAIRIQPDFARAYFNRGIYREKKRDWDDAIADYSEAIRLGLRTSSAFHARGNAKTAIEDWKGALEDLEEAIRIDPRDPRPYGVLGAVRVKQGDPSAALRDFEKALSLDPDSLDAHYHRGKLYRETGKLEAAKKDLDEAVRIKPDWAEPYEQRGLLFAAMRRLPDAIEDYTRAIERNPNNSANFYNRGNAKRDLGDPKGALQDYDRAIELYPKYSDAFNNRGRVRWDQGDPAGAHADFTRAIELDPRNAPAYNNRGALRTELGKPDEAIADCTEAIRLVENYFKAYVNRALAKARKKDLAGARADLDFVRQQAPADSPDRLAAEHFWNVFRQE